MYVCLSDNIWCVSIFLFFFFFFFFFFSFSCVNSPVFTCIAATAVFDIRFVYFMLCIDLILYICMFSSSFVCIVCILLYICFSKTMADLTRPLTVRFATRHYTRLGHEEILEGLEEILHKSEVKAIQVTETTCFVTVATREAKETLLSSGLNIREMFNSVYEVEQVITNVTIKDAPFELSDGFILHHMKQYGDVIENSLKRCTIKGTDIETGTRYVQMANVRNVLPTVVDLGRFKVRTYSDNKTECRICKETGHPFFRCPQKALMRPRICGRCKSSEHRTRECTNDVVCNFCDESGHKQKDCDE